MKFWKKADEAGFKIPSLSPGKKKEVFINSQCIKLDGKYVASLILSQCKDLAATHPTTPCMAVILIGNDPASQIYVKNKEKIFKEIGFKSQIYTQEEDTSTEDILELIHSLSENNSVHGILVQLPLPKYLDTEKILSAIPAHKDVDGFHHLNMGALTQGTPVKTIPCTPMGIMVLLAAYEIDLEKKNVLVIGRSNIVGKPVALLAMEQNATITIAHSRTKSIQELSNKADIIISAVGKENTVTPDMIKKETIIIDVGINRKKDGTLGGDVSSEVISQAKALTPVPKGVGPLTIAMLAVNAAILAWT